MAGNSLRYMPSRHLDLLKIITSYCATLNGAKCWPEPLGIAETCADCIALLSHALLAFRANIRLSHLGGLYECRPRPARPDSYHCHKGRKELDCLCSSLPCGIPAAFVPDDSLSGIFFPIVSSERGRPYRIITLPVLFPMMVCRVLDGFPCV